MPKTLCFMHTCRTAHDFDAVVKCGIGQLFGIVRIVAAHGADGRIDAVFADLSDTEAPGLKAGFGNPVCTYAVLWWFSMLLPTWTRDRKSVV